MDLNFKLIAEPRRQEILRLIWDGERSAGEIAERVAVTFSAVSQHLAKMRAAGIVVVRRDGRRRLYSCRKSKLGPLAAYLESLWSERLGRLKRLAEAEEDAADGRK